MKEFHLPSVKEKILKKILQFLKSVASELLFMIL